MHTASVTVWWHQHTSLASDSGSMMFTAAPAVFIRRFHPLGGFFLSHRIYPPSQGIHPAASWRMAWIWGSQCRSRQFLGIPSCAEKSNPSWILKVLNQHHLRSIPIPPQKLSRVALTTDQRRLSLRRSAVSDSSFLSTNDASAFTSQLLRTVIHTVLSRIHTIQCIHPIENRQLDASSGVVRLLDR